MAFGGIPGTPGGGGLGPGGNTSACGCIGAEYCRPGALGFSNDEISGPSRGSGAWSLVCVGLRPTGGWTTG